MFHKQVAALKDHYRLITYDHRGQGQTEVTADGYDIYHEQKVIRSVYALRGDVVAGNSGGPVINSSGEVAGIIFGHSTNQNKTGYAITSDQVASTVKTAQGLNSVVSAGPCAA